MELDTERTGTATGSDAPTDYVVHLAVPEARTDARVYASVAGTPGEGGAPTEPAPALPRAARWP